MAAEDQLYPMSTEKGEPIPLDIVAPLAARVVAIAAGAHTAFTLTAGYRYASISATVDCVIDFTGTLTYPFADGTSALIVHAGGVHTVALPSLAALRVIPLIAAEAGILKINAIQKWAGIGLNRQLSRR